MKLSEAIRLGSMLHPQTFERYWSEKHGTCALGAALEAINYKDIPILDTSLKQKFPILNTKIKQCDICYDDVYHLLNHIIHLNDEHRWTREAIADFVEEIENESERTGSSSHRREFNGENNKEKV